MAEGKHLFPFRTEKLSPPAPMVLPGRLGGRVGRCPLNSREAPPGEPGGAFVLGVRGARPPPAPHPRESHRGATVGRGSSEPLAAAGHSSTARRTARSTRPRSGGFGALCAN